MKSTLLIKKRRKPARVEEPQSLSLRDYWKMKTLATLLEINSCATSKDTKQL